MIDIPTLRRLIDAGERRVVFDTAGELLESGEAPEKGAALLIVASVTDAVKVVTGDLVRGSLDRETLWAIEGFALGSEVVRALGDGVATPGELIEAVTSAGFEWQVIRTSSSST